MPPLPHKCFSYSPIQSSLLYQTWQKALSFRRVILLTFRCGLVGRDPRVQQKHSDGGGGATMCVCVCACVRSVTIISETKNRKRAGISTESVLWVTCWQCVTFQVKGPVLNEAQSHENVLGSGGIAPRILNIGTRWRLVVSFMSRQLYPRSKCPRYALDSKLVGPQSGSTLRAGKKSHLCLCRESNPPLSTQ
jgi:hypothetical protein